MSETLLVSSGRLEVEFEFSADRPVRLSSARPGDAASLLTAWPLVTAFTTDERQSSRMSAAYADSAIGERLRYVSHRRSEDERQIVLEILQRDAVSGLALTSTVTLPRSAAAIRFSHALSNEGEAEIVLLSLSSAAVGFGSSEHDLDALDLIWGESGWTTEGRWHQQPLRGLLPRAPGRYGQDTADRFARTSTGTWSTGRWLPTGVLVDRGNGAALAWQIESSGPWHWEVGQSPSGGYLAVLGPTDREHGFAARLAPGQSFTAAPAAVAFSASGRDGAFGALTDYRRSRRDPRPVDHGHPVVYNDFMNTLMGDPSTERLEPLIRAAADAGAEVFCIDAGWFAAAGDDDWWDGIGDWREGADRFAGGLDGVVARIRESGMVPGLWLEPEVVGVNSAIAARLPDDAVFRRLGSRVVTQRRLHLDLRHAAARAQLDATVDQLVERFGIGYLKLDYNIDPGAGTDVAAASPAEGLLGHVRAHRDWLDGVRRRHPGLLLENCAAGAMRMDDGLLALCDVQSTSDQPDHLRYPPIAASAPASLLPEQAGNWAYPAARMGQEETAFSLVAGLVGRLTLSGFLDRLDPVQRELVRQAVAVSKAWRDRVAASHPVWPLGLPDWEAPELALALDCGEEYLLAVWSRGGGGVTTLRFPGPVDAPEPVYPLQLPSWQTRSQGSSLSVEFPPGPSARLLRVPKAG